MQTRGWTWLRDADGKAIAPEALPKNLGLKQFANDQYRGCCSSPATSVTARMTTLPRFRNSIGGHWLRTQTDPSGRNDFALTEFNPYLTLVGNVAKGHGRPAR